MTSDAPSVPLVTALLPESEMPTHWYNIQADLPEPALAGADDGVFVAQRAHVFSP